MKFSFTLITKYVKDITCTCIENFTIQHILFECKDLTDKYEDKSINIKSFQNIDDLLDDRQILEVLDILLNSKIANLL